MQYAEEYTRRNENQVGIFDHLCYFVPALRGSLGTHRGAATCPESTIIMEMNRIYSSVYLNIYEKSYREVKLPIFSFFGAKLLDNAWASVFTAHNSTPNIPVELSIILLTAFPPPPPTPITFIRHGEPDPSATHIQVTIL